MAALADRDPLVTADDLDEDVSELAFSIDDYYAGAEAGRRGRRRSPPGSTPPCGRSSRTWGRPSRRRPRSRRPASALIARLERDLIEHVYRWTGHFPERTPPAPAPPGRAAPMRSRLAYPEHRETAAIVALTTLVTTLAMNHVQRGEYAS